MPRPVWLSILIGNFVRCLPPASSQLLQGAPRSSPVVDEINFTSNLTGIRIMNFPWIEIHLAPQQTWRGFIKIYYVIGNLNLEFPFRFDKQFREDNFPSRSFGKGDGLRKVSWPPSLFGHPRAKECASRIFFEANFWSFVAYRLGGISLRNSMKYN